MELIFRRDAYATSTEATVLAVDERGLVLDRTVFYPTGAGSRAIRAFCVMTVRKSD